MRLPQLLAVAILSAVAASTAQAAAKTPYVTELNRQCPGRHLENLTAGDLELIMEGFATNLSPDQRHQIEAAIGERCVRIEAGLTCGNNATLDVFRRQKVLKAFVHEVCATTWKCDTYYRCVQAQP